MHRKRQTQNYLKTTQSFQRNLDLKETRLSPQKRSSLVARRNLNMNSTEKLKTRVSIDYNANRAVKENNNDLIDVNDDNDQFDSNFNQTNETPFLDLKILHQQSPSTDNAKSQRDQDSMRLEEADESQDLVDIDQNMPNSIHEMKETNRSSQYQFKTPKAGCDDNTDDFRGSCAKQIPVTQFDETNLEGARQLDEVLRRKSSIGQAFHNYKNSFQSFDNDLVLNQYSNMGITSNSNEKNKDRALNTETYLGVNSSIFSPTAVAMEQTLSTTYQCHEQGIEPEITQDDDEFQPLSLELNFKQVGDVKIVDREDNDDDLQAPGSAGFQHNSMNKKAGSLISMGRQSNLVNNILSAGSLCKNKNASSISKGRTPIHEKQFNTSSRQTLKVQKFELGAASNHKRTTTAQVSNYNTVQNNIEKVTKDVDIYKSFQDKKKPMEPMIIQRSNNQVPLKSNYNTEVRNSNSRVGTRRSTLKTGKTDNLQLSSKRGSSLNNQLSIEKTKASHQVSQSVSFTGLSAEQVARRKNSLSKDPFTKQQQQRHILAKKTNALLGKQSFSKNKGVDAYMSNNSQKTSSRYNFSSNIKGQSNEVSMQNLKLNLQNGNSNLLKDLKSVRSGVKQQLNLGISDYVKQLKQNDKKIMNDVYQDAYRTNNHHKQSSKTSYKSCHSKSQSQESKYSRRSKRESRRSTSKINQSVIVPQQNSQKTRLCELKQKYSGLNRMTSGSRMNICRLNSSVQSLHAQLSRANSHAVSKKDLEQFTSSRNEPNSQQVSLSNKLHAESFDQKSEGTSSNHRISYSNLSNIRGVIQTRHQTKSVNYQSCKTIKKVHSQVQQLRNSICLTGKNTKGTFEDVVRAEQKKQAELLKIEKMKEAKKKANNYLRNGKNRSESVNQQSSRDLLRSNQQKNIQEKLFQRYKLSSKPGSNQNQAKVFIKTDPEDVEKEISQVDQVKTPDRKIAQRESSVTPDQKQSYQRFTKSVKFINMNLGPVLKGYKIRRLFHNNQCIKENRVKFRDLVQFVFFLQEEINDINQKIEIMGDDAILTAEHNFAKHYLSLALEEIISIRTRFQEEFHHQLLVNSWMEETQPRIVHMNYKQESQYDKIRHDYLQNIKNLLAEKKEQDAQMRLMQLNLAESKQQVQNKVYKTTVISTINDLNTMEEEDEDLIQEMERQLSCSQTVYPVKVQNQSPEKIQQDYSQKMSIVENECSYQSPTKLSSTLQKNLKSLQSDQKVVYPQICIQENDSPGVSPSLSQFKTVKQTPYNRSPMVQKQNLDAQSPGLPAQPIERKTPRTPEQAVYLKSFDNSPDKISPELEPKKQSPVKYCQKVKESKFQQQLSPQKRTLTSPQKVQKLIDSMKTTPEKFESKIPRCTSNSKTKIPRVYREAFSNSKIPRSSAAHSRNSSVNSLSKPRTQVPKLNLSKISNYQDSQSPIPIQKIIDQSKHSKSVIVDLQDNEPSFEIRLANIKKQSAELKKQSMHHIKKNSVEHVSFNCSKNFEKCGGLPKVDEEPILLQELSFLDDYDNKSEQSECCINPMQIVSTAQEETIIISDIQLEEQELDQEQKLKSDTNQFASIFSNSQSCASSFLDNSKQGKATIESQNSKLSQGTFQTQFNKRKNSMDKLSKSAKIKSSQKKTQKKRISPMKENSPQKVSKFINLNTISTEFLRKEESPQKCSPIKGKDIQVANTQYNSQPVSVNQRRPRNQRSQDKSAQKPKVKALEPFKDQTEACVNSPQIFIPEQSEHNSNVSKQSQDQLMNQVSQIQQMIVNLQKQKSESAASSNGQVFDDAYKVQFEQMINGLKNQFDALTK